MYLPSIGTSTYFEALVYHGPLVQSGTSKNDAITQSDGIAKE